jgi:C1A family cysteine protease
MSSFVKHLLCVLRVLPMLVLASSAFAQGVILETMEDLVGKPEPPVFRSTLPPRADLSATIPAPRNQADTGTCTSWGATYAAASQAARRNGLGTVILSPAFTYNLVAGDHTCRAATSTSATLDVLKNVGALPIEDFAFDAGWCGRQPTAVEKLRAARYRINGWSRFDASDVNTVKQQIARGVPVIFGIRVGAVVTGLRGDAVVEEDRDVTLGHAMVAVGYDDNRKAFRIQNSWGRGWGDGGYGWFGYDFWKRNVKVGFIIE